MRIATSKLVIIFTNLGDENKETTTIEFVVNEAHLEYRTNLFPSPQDYSYPPEYNHYHSAGYFYLVGKDDEVIAACNNLDKIIAENAEAEIQIKIYGFNTGWIDIFHFVKLEICDSNTTQHHLIRFSSPVNKTSEKKKSTTDTIQI